MRSSIAKIRGASPATALMVFGLLATLLVVMFRPSGAIGTQARSILVYPQPDSVSPSTVDLGELPQTTKNYDIKFNGDKTANVPVTGRTIADLLKAAGADPAQVPFVRVRVGTPDDANLVLVPLLQDNPDHPPMIVEDSGRGPSGQKLPTPSILPGQATALVTLQQIPFFNARTTLRIVPAKPGAQILTGVRIKAKKRKSGKIVYSVDFTDNNKPKGGVTYKWFDRELSGDIKTTGDRETFTVDPTNAKKGASQSVVSVVVTGSQDDSAGVASTTYTSTKANDGSKTGPPQPTPETGSTPGTGTGNGTGSNPGTNGSGNGAGTYIPPNTSQQSTPQQQTTQPTAQTTQPTPETSTSTPAVTDTSGIANIAQNVIPGGQLQTVSGVLLSSPTVPAAAVGGGTPLSELPAPVADAANTIFQPVEDAGDLWPYLLAVMFALCISGGIREWVNP